MWSRDEHFAAFIVESSLLRVIVSVFLFVTVSLTQLCLFSRCLVKLYTLIAVIWRTFLKQIHSRCTCTVWSIDVQRITSAYHHDLWVVPMNGWWMKYWQLARWYFMRWHQSLLFYYSWSEKLWAGPSDEHGKVGSLCSCDEHRTIMILEERTLKEVLVYILAVYKQFFWKASQRLSLQLFHCVVSGDTHTSHCGILRYVVQTCWCAHGGPSDDPCYIRAVCFCDEHRTTKIRETLVDTWWLAWWKPSTCVFVTEPVILLVLKHS